MIHHIAISINPYQTVKLHFPKVFFKTSSLDENMSDGQCQKSHCQKK